MPWNVVIAETYPAECYGWFDVALGSKWKQGDRKKFSASLLRWAIAEGITLDDRPTEHIQGRFPQGDDAFDAVVGLFGMLKVRLGEREPGEPDEDVIREIEGWILPCSSETT